MIKNIFWDLDGTLTDSSEGILNSVELVFRHFGITDYDRSRLTCFIGPPLRDTFPRFGIPEEQMEEAIEVFRSRYNTIGKFENRPYDGIEQLLERLQAEGFHMFVATSKPEITARQVLEKFHLAGYFEIICGATMDGRIDSKAQVIEYLLQQAGSADLSETIMVGDSRYDVLGAKAFGIDAICVSWGFDDRESMEKAGAVAIVDTMDELHAFLHSKNPAPRLPESHGSCPCGGSNG